MLHLLQVTPFSLQCELSRMPQICRILKWVCSFLIAAAIANLTAPISFPWALWMIAIAALLFYVVGQKTDDWQLQVIATGLVFGAVQWYYGG